MALSCEVCGGTLLVRGEDGLFRCSDCGAAYSADTLKKKLSGEPAETEAPKLSAASELALMRITELFKAGDYKAAADGLDSMAGSASEFGRITGELPDGLFYGELAQAIVLENQYSLFRVASFWLGEIARKESGPNSVDRAIHMANLVINHAISLGKKCLETIKHIEYLLKTNVSQELFEELFRQQVKARAFIACVNDTSLLCIRAISTIVLKGTAISASQLMSANSFTETLGELGSCLGSTKIDLARIREAAFSIDEKSLKQGIPENEEAIILEAVSVWNSGDYSLANYLFGLIREDALCCAVSALFCWAYEELEIKAMCACALCSKNVDSLLSKVNDLSRAASLLGTNGHRQFFETVEAIAVSISRTFRELDAFSYSDDQFGALKQAINEKKQFLLLALGNCFAAIIGHVEKMLEQNEPASIGDLALIRKYLEWVGETDSNVVRANRIRKAKKEALKQLGRNEQYQELREKAKLSLGSEMRDIDAEIQKKKQAASVTGPFARRKRRELERELGNLQKKRDMLEKRLTGDAIVYAVWDTL